MYASAACGALYRWASVAVDVAQALQSLYPLKLQVDALEAERAAQQAKLSQAEARLAETQVAKSERAAEVERLKAMLAEAARGTW